MKTMYFVIGGIFTTTDFDHLEEGGSEIHGPYQTEAEAERVWRGSTTKNMDICCHRLFVVPVSVPD
jgi:hypothetical protein